MPEVQQIPSCVHAIFLDWKKCFLIYPQLHFDTLFYFLGPARRTVAVAGGSGHRHQSIIIPAQIGGRQQEKGTIRQLASKPHE